MASTPTVAGARRFAARVRRRRWESVRPRLLAAVGVGIAVLVGWAVLFSPLLAVRDVRVVGAAGSAPRSADVAVEQVRAAAVVPLGTPLARLDGAAIRRRAAALPAVGAVRVDRRWPATVTLHVHERVPVAVTRHGSQLLQVDAAGVPFAPVPNQGAPDAVELVVAAAGPTDPATRAALAVLSALPAELRADVRTVSASSAVSVSLGLRSGATVVWGEPMDSGRKAAVLAALLHRPAKVYDVSAPGIAVTR
ncbi:MAG: FtsQ-type POTRA domain-containing protein [Actinomycetota bacterium]|nr:FtsQ-type POTRA domain-containing protein [Actinomycetota bacterium]